MTQHYILYRGNNVRLQAEEEESRGGYATLASINEDPAAF